MACSGQYWDSMRSHNNIFPRLLIVGLYYYNGWGGGPVP